MHIVVINREDRQDRLEQIKDELRKQELNAVRFNAIIDSVGWKGCRDSHLSVLEHSYDYKQFMVLEDDAMFLEGITDAMGLWEFDLPKDWDMLYLGCSPQSPQQKHSDFLYKITEAKCTHAIIWHNRVGGAIDYILAHKDEIKKFDRYLMEVIQPKFNCFCIYPMLVTQRESKSNIAQRSDVSTILKNFNKYCP
jgi:GR25 family glycosyltransferase involved in LPS biosynthesis